MMILGILKFGWISRENYVKITFRLNLTIDLKSSRSVYSLKLSFLCYKIFLILGNEDLGEFNVIIRIVI